ncbi:MAG: GTP-binding protein, partial [Phycisphaerales bacterium]
VVVVNKCDRPNARVEEVVDEVFDLLVALDASDERLDFQVIYASGRDGWSTTKEGVHEGDMQPMLDAILSHLPAPVGYADVPLQMLIASVDYSPYAGRIAIGRVMAGALSAGQAVTICHEHSHRQARAQKLYRFKDLGKTPAEL